MIGTTGWAEAMNSKFLISDMKLGPRHDTKRDKE